MTFQDEIQYKDVTYHNINSYMNMILILFNCIFYWVSRLLTKLTKSSGIDETKVLQTKFLCSCPSTPVIYHITSTITAILPVSKYYTDPQLVSNMEPSTCSDAMPKSATRILLRSSNRRFSGFKSRWLSHRHHKHQCYHTQCTWAENNLPQLANHLSIQDGTW